MNNTVCFFDLETTDKSIDTSKICMIAIYKFDKETKTVIDIYKKYVNPTVPVENEAFKVHGLSNTFLSNHLVFKLSTSAQIVDSLHSIFNGIMTTNNIHTRKEFDDFAKQTVETT